MTMFFWLPHSLTYSHIHRDRYIAMTDWLTEMRRGMATTVLTKSDLCDLVKVCPSRVYSGWSKVRRQMSKWSHSKAHWILWWCYLWLLHRRMFLFHHGSCTYNKMMKKICNKFFQNVKNSFPEQFSQWASGRKRFLLIKYSLYSWSQL